MKSFSNKGVLTDAEAVAEVERLLSIPQVRGEVAKAAIESAAHWAQNTKQDKLVEKTVNSLRESLKATVEKGLDKRILLCAVAFVCVEMGVDIAKEHMDVRLEAIQIDGTPVPPRSASEMKN